MCKRDETSYSQYSSHRYINIIYRTSNLSQEKKKNKYPQCSAVYIIDCEPWRDQLFASLGNERISKKEKKKKRNKQKYIWYIPQKEWERTRAMCLI